MRLVHFAIPWFGLIVTILPGALLAAATDNSTTFNDDDVPIKVILEDVKALVDNRSSEERELSSRSNNNQRAERKKTLVGVKQHRNYEVALYEYSEEDDGSPKEEQPGDESELLPMKEDEINKEAEPPISLINNNSSRFTPLRASVSSLENTAAEEEPKNNISKQRTVLTLYDIPGGGNVTTAQKKAPQEDTPYEWSPEEINSFIQDRTVKDIHEQNPDRHVLYDATTSEEIPGGPRVSHDTRKTTDYRQSIEDAPGAGRFIPRRRHPFIHPSDHSSEFNLTGQSDLQKAENDQEDPEAEEDDEDGVLYCKDPTGRKGVCEEYFRCSYLYTESAGRVNLQDYKCELGNEIGICCPSSERDRQARGRPGRALKSMEKRKPISRQVRRLIQSHVNSSIAFGSDSILQLEEIELDLLSRGEQVTPDSPAFGHNRFFPTSKKIRQVSEFGFELLQTTNDLTERLRLDEEFAGLGLRNFKSSNTEAIQDRCPRSPQCGINKYRQIDGSCNNLRKPKMGQALTPLSRVLEPAYADGRWEPRISVRGFLLPSARMLSQRFVQDRDNPNSRFTLLLMQFGQFIDHDISSVPIFTFPNGTGISCCRNGRFLSPQDRHPNCLPIEIPANDAFYSQFRQRCMNFVRSRIAPRIDCSLGYADQMNAVTHWLDLSNVYGSSDTEARDLRFFESGLLQFSELADRRMLLPLKRTSTGGIDYKAGDNRVNEMQGLMVMHLIWMREHNRIAIELSRINPFWNDEQLFQEARRIVIAEYQHILYNEWLPVIVGREYMESYSILPLNRKTYYQGYDPEIDVSIENSFSAAGFRMGHSLVQGIVRLFNEFGESNEAVAVSNHADNAVRTRAPNQIDKWIRGLTQQPIQSFDPFVSQQLNGRLFQARGGVFGMDLTALNIQRARDHGIPGYNAFRELCQTGNRARSFDEFKDWIAPEIIDEMRRIYDHPDDVDLWIGGLSETPLRGALLGPTFTCIVGDQFARSKKGDRYFYDIGDQTHSFTPDQLQEIRKASMARILCDNGDDLEAMQPASFLPADVDINALADCRQSMRIPRINLRLWANEPTPR